MNAHLAVMKQEMLEQLNPQGDGIYVDGTFGAGGYSRAILEQANCRVFAIDRDPSTKEFAQILEQEFPNRFVWLLGNFGDMCSLLAMHGVEQVNGVALDLGVSSMQLDQAERGFSFRQNGPLDMRMGPDAKSAADLVNTASEEELADILYYYGEEKAARRIAKAIVQARAELPLTTTRELADLVRQALGGQHGKSDPATRSFQAFRIYVNQEFDAIERGLQAAERLLAPGGRLVVVTFHSLEDRLVKRFISSRCGRLGEPSRHMPEKTMAAPHFFTPVQKIKPSSGETAANPRARSATLRVMERHG